jgi:hypothetical protein
MHVYKLHCTFGEPRLEALISLNSVTSQKPR